VCSRVNLVVNRREDSVNVDGELVDRFCYLGDILSIDGRADVAVMATIESGWNKFRQLSTFLTVKGIPFD